RWADTATNAGDAQQQEEGFIAQASLRRVAAPIEDGTISPAATCRRPSGRSRSGYAQRSEGYREGMGGESLPGHRLDGRENVRRGLRRTRNLSLRQQRTGRRNAESAAERLGGLIAARRAG